MFAALSFFLVLLAALWGGSELAVAQTQYACQSICGSGPSSIREADTAIDSGACDASSVEKCQARTADYCDKTLGNTFTHATCVSPVPEWDGLYNVVDDVSAGGGTGFLPVNAAGKCDESVCCCLTGQVAVALASGTLTLSGETKGKNCSGSFKKTLTGDFLTWEQGKTYAFVSVLGGTYFVQYNGENMTWWPQNSETFTKCGMVLAREVTPWWVWLLVGIGGTCVLCVCCTGAVCLHHHLRKRRAAKRAELAGGFATVQDTDGKKKTDDRSEIHGDHRVTSTASSSSDGTDDSGGEARPSESDPLLPRT